MIILIEFDYFIDLQLISTTKIVFNHIKSMNMQILGDDYSAKFRYYSYLIAEIFNMNQCGENGR